MATVESQPTLEQLEYLDRVLSARVALVKLAAVAHKAAIDAGSRMDALSNYRLEMQCQQAADALFDVLNIASSHRVIAGADRWLQAALDGRATVNR